MNINMQSLLSSARNDTFRIPTPVIRIQAPLTQAVDSSASTVAISDAGRRAASLDQVGGIAKTGATSELRDFIKQYDFHSISPRQMTAVYAEIVKQEKLSSLKETERFASFISVEMNTVVEMNPDKPIDMVAHFKRMLDDVETDARSDPTLNYGVEYRRQASQALNDVISFANSDRQHI